MQAVSERAADRAAPMPDIKISARQTFGIDTDTFSGDSGAPVFDRKTQCIAGVFGGGEDDQLVTSVEDAWHTMALVEAAFESAAAPATTVKAEF